MGPPVESHDAGRSVILARLNGAGIRKKKANCELMCVLTIEYRRSHSSNPAIPNTYCSCAPWVTAQTQMQTAGINIKAKNNKQPERNAKKYSYL